jgi:putative FmdB family regulatory protein
MLQTVTYSEGEHARDFFRIFFSTVLPHKRSPVAKPPCHPQIDRPVKIKTGSLFPEERVLPLYEYRCTACGYSFEKIQNFSANPETECPKCQGTLIRPVTAPALRFEGAGWYVNDYAAKGGTKKAEGAGEAAASDSAKDTKTESKPDSSSSETKSTPAAPAAAAAAPAASSTPAPSS